MAWLQPRELLRQAPRDLLYVGLSAPIGLAWIIALLIGFVVGAALTVIIVGLLLLACTVELARLGARIERARAALVLGAPIAQPVLPRPAGGVPRRLWARYTDRVGWKEVGFMLLLGTVGTTLGAIVVAPVVRSPRGRRRAGFPRSRAQPLVARPSNRMGA